MISLANHGVNFTPAMEMLDCVQHSNILENSIFLQSYMCPQWDKGFKTTLVHPQVGSHQFYTIHVVGILKASQNYKSPYGALSMAAYPHKAPTKAMFINKSFFRSLHVCYPRESFSYIAWILETICLFNTTIILTLWISRDACMG